MVDFLIAIMFIPKEMRFKEGPHMVGIHFHEISRLGTTETESKLVVARFQEEGVSTKQ